MVNRRPTVYLEGGGTKVFEQKTYRIGFAKMIHQRADVIPCGGNVRTHEKFVQHNGDGPALLLVDSEEPVAPDDSALQHLKRTMVWNWPDWVREEQVHLMATAIETWMSCDPQALAKYFGPAFNASKVVATNPKNSGYEPAPVGWLHGLEVCDYWWWTGR